MARGGQSLPHLGELIDDQWCVKHGVQARNQDSAPLLSHVLILREHGCPVLQLCLISQDQDHTSGFQPQEVGQEPTVTQEIR